MTEGHEHEAMVLDVLKRAVAEALERKRKLGQSAVIWREAALSVLGPMRQSCQVSRQPGRTRNLVSTSSNALPSRRRTAAK